jgi:hypothetical protein
MSGEEFRLDVAKAIKYMPQQPSRLNRGASSKKVKDHHPFQSSEPIVAGEKDEEEVRCRRPGQGEVFHSQVDLADEDHECFL